MMQDYVTFKCLSTKIDQLSDEYEKASHHSDLVDDFFIRRSIKDQRSKVMRNKSEPNVRQTEWEALCYLLYVVDLILYSKSGHVTEFLYMAFDTDDEMEKASKYPFDIVETNERIDFTYEYDIEYMDRFNPKMFESKRIEEDGVKFVSYVKIKGKDAYLCRVSISKEGFKELAEDIIDSGELEELNQKKTALF